ncbi:unnamed protein product [Closterium sp. Naga37s-1]|nr:unnamed protein product [Closterium sp. Naga37s-1]
MVYQCNPCTPRLHGALGGGRYALDVNTERAEDVLTHKRLLEEAARLHGLPVFFVRAVRMAAAGGAAGAEEAGPHASMETDDHHPALPPHGALAPPAFGSSPNLEAPVPGGGHGAAGAMDDDRPTSLSAPYHNVPMHEVTFSTFDRPKLLSQLSAVLADAGLNIREAHVFSTFDGLSLDVFVVDGWPTEDVVDLHAALVRVLQMGAGAALSMQPEASGQSMQSMQSAPGPAGSESAGMGGAGAGGQGAGSHVSGAESRVPIPTDGRDDWEIDSQQLKLHHKIASGSFGDLYRGTYCGQDVAIKILKPERLSDSLQQEFAQEVYIMRKVRHKNVVQFIGACTKPPNLSIVTEFMVGGSVYDYIHKQRGSMRLGMVVRVGMDVAKGMDFLHKNNIIHRDLKAANLLMDENEVVKVADFGVARVKAGSGIMTAETGTYRWMAPEVIEHRAYDHKADVFSFAITLWELLTGKLPYADLTPLQAAVSVVQKGLRPPIPKGTHPRLAELMARCWHTNPAERPEFSAVLRLLADMAHEGMAHEVRGKGMAHEVRGKGMAHEVRGKGMAHEVRGKGMAHEVRGKGMAHEVRGKGMAHVVRGKCMAHEVRGKGMAHEVRGKGMAHEVRGKGMAHEVRGKGMAHEVRGKGMAHEVRGKGMAHEVRGKGMAHEVRGKGMAHEVRGKGMAHEVRGKGMAHEVRGKGMAHEVRGKGMAHEVRGKGMVHEVRGKGMAHEVRGKGMAHEVRVCRRVHFLPAPRCISLSPSAPLSIRPSLHPPLSPSAPLSIRPSLHPPLSPSAPLSIRPSLHPPLSICPSIHVLHITQTSQKNHLPHPNSLPPHPVPPCLLCALVRV